MEISDPEFLDPQIVLDHGIIPVEGVDEEIVSHDESLISTLRADDKVQPHSFMFMDPPRPRGWV